MLSNKLLKNRAKFHHILLSLVFFFGAFRFEDIDKWVFVIYIVFLLLFYSSQSFIFIKKKPVYYLFILAIYGWIINSYFWFTSNDYSGFLFSSMKLSGLALFCTGVMIALEENFNTVFKWLILGGLCGVTLNYGYFLVENSYFSQSGFFNNVNQLSRYLLFLSCLGVFGYWKENNSKFYFFANIYFISIGFAYSFYSFRRAALIGFAVLAIILLWKNRRLFMLSAMASFFFVLLTMLAKSQNGLNTQLEYINDRVIESANWNSHLIGRGYLRILKHPSYMILGAGEGGFERFSLVFEEMAVEIHNVFLNNLFSYGIFGLIVVILYFRRTIPQNKIGLLVLPVLVHAMFHNDFYNILFISIPLILMRGNLLIEKS